MITFQGLPSFDLENGLLCAWWFEPLLATMSFAFWVNFYWHHERIRGLSNDKRFIPDGHYYGAWWYQSVSAYWIGIYILKLFAPTPSSQIPNRIPHSVSDLAYVLVELVAGVVAYDTIIFFVHWALHDVPVLRKFHRTHHHQHDGNLESRDTLNHSLVDGSLQVIVNILVQRTTPWGSVKTRLARALHNIFVTWMLVESHTSSPYPNIWRRFFVGVRNHRMHHIGGKHCHQQFFGYLDNLRDACFACADETKIQFKAKQL
uniref:Fatty acid hydroxylase domain-containing protein n=1 Tax=Ditylum brightwellii TaxID=49249 RepID=A0A6U3QQ77_9STRA